MTKDYRPYFKPFYYAFVQFDTIENARKAAEEYRFPCFKSGMMSRVQPFNAHARQQAGRNDLQNTQIFVKGFDKLGWTHADLYSKFCVFGKIVSCKVSLGPDHKFHGFGYIQFSKLEEAQKAINEVSSFLRF